MLSRQGKSQLGKRIMARLLIDIMPTTGLLVVLALAMTWWNC
jgi:hypothetical protein